MEKKKISIIVPIYKVEKYLDRCIESLVNQTYKNLEIILVDDGSPDNCPAMCDAWKMKDDRIKVIHKANGGLSEARNAGLDIVTGDYIMFVDSDDTIHYQTCEILIIDIYQFDADIAMCDLKKVSDVNLISNTDFIRYKHIHRVYRDDDVYALLFNKKIPLIMVACGKLYKKYIFDNLRFDEGKIHEDEFIIHKILHKCNTFSYVNLPLYNYLQRPNSITSKNFSVKSLNVIEALENRIDFTRQYRHQYLKDAIYQYQKACILCHYKAKWGKLDKNLLKQLDNKIDNYYKLGYKKPLVKIFKIAPKFLELLVFIKLKVKVL